MNKKPISSRRHFLKNTIIAGGLSATALNLSAGGFLSDEADKNGNSTTFLFQGDSITDGNRSRNNDWNHVMGHGYQYIIASKLWYEFPKKGLHFFNRGISGNKVSDLAARWQKDTLDIKPDILSILVGINDTASFINGNKIFTSEYFETGYRELLQLTKQQLPKVQMVICEPFILPVGKVKDNWELYFKELQTRQQITKRLSEETGAIFVGLQEPFNQATEKAPAEYWIWDGVHPMPAGHELIAREWRKQVTKKLKFIR